MIQSKRYFFIIIIFLTSLIPISLAYASNSDRVYYLIELLQEPLDDESQKKIAEELIQILEAKGFSIATEVLPAAVFYSAESYHQDYYDRKGGVPYCHGYRKLF